MSIALFILDLICPIALDLLPIIRHHLHIWIVQWYHYQLFWYINWNPKCSVETPIFTKYLLNFHVPRPRCLLQPALGAYFKPYRAFFSLQARCSLPVDPENHMIYTCKLLPPNFHWGRNSSCPIDGPSTKITLSRPEQIRWCSSSLHERRYPHSQCLLLREPFHNQLCLVVVECAIPFVLDLVYPFAANT